MKISVYENGKSAEKSTLLEAIDIDIASAPIMSVVGAGGKTTFIQALANEYQLAKKSACVTTTTHMWFPTQKEFVAQESKEEVLSYIKDQRVFWSGTKKEEKITAVSEGFLTWLCGQKIPVLIEADGSKRLPCKVPAEHEPVLIKKTTHVIGVLGMDALGQPIEQVCHRKELVSKLLEKPLSHLLDETDMAKIIGTTKGLRKGVTEKMEFICVLNKIDNKELQERAIKIARELEKYNCNRVIFTAKEAE